MATFGIHVLGLLVRWSSPPPGSGGALVFFREVVLTLAVFSNIVFIFTSGMRRLKSITITNKSFLIAAVVINGSLALFFPKFALLPTYWLWLASFVVLAFAFISFPGRDEELDKKLLPPADADSGAVPTIILVWLGMTVFWLAISGINRFHPTVNTRVIAQTDAAEAALSGYFNDPANVIATNRAAQIGNALSAFEQETSNQIVVAVYPRVPHDSIEQFTIETAERSRLGRKGLDNGTILFVFMAERVARLEIGYGLEAVITDVEAHRILETQLMPAFTKGNYGDGLDATLAAMFKSVKDAYQSGKMPGRLAVYWLQLKVKIPKIIDQAWPALSAVEVRTRIGISFFAGLLGMGVWDGVRQSVKLLRNLTRGVGHIGAGRSFATGMEGIGLESIVDTIKVSGFLLAFIVGGASLVIVAGGGAFGGAGAQVRW